MSDLPDQWREYARLQEKLAKRQQVDDYTWGLEAGLNRSISKDLPAAEEVVRAVKSASRKERYQEQLRHIHLADQESAKSPVDVVEARRRLRVITNLVTPEEFALLRAVGEGYAYKEFAAIQKTAPSALRTRVLRLRRNLLALAS